MINTTYRGVNALVYNWENKNWECFIIGIGVFDGEAPCLSIIDIKHTGVNTKNGFQRIGKQIAFT